MGYQLEIQKEAREDMQNAFDYYESKRIGLGDKFLDTVDFYLSRIQKHPLHYPIKDEGLREAYIKKFPYVISYEQEGRIVVIYAVFNTYQNPNKKPSKE